MTNKTSVAQKRGQKNAKEEKILIVSKDSVRTLRPHSNKFKSHGVVVLDTKELQRIQYEAKGISQEKLKEEKAALEKQTLEDVARNRTARILALEAERNKEEEGNDSNETSEQRNSILEKAKRQMEEREDEIKKMNEFIEEAKCMAIREAQISEKSQISSALKQDDARLDAIMEYNRVKALETMFEKEQKRKIELKQGARVVRQQIEERREAALLAAEKREQEAKKILDDLARRNELEAKKKEELAKKKKKHLDEVLEANKESIVRKKEEKIKSKEEDKKILEYLVEKANKEEQKEKGEKQRKAEREKEFSKLRAQQQLMQDTRAEQDALRAKRASEYYEREWRRKEKEAAEKKARQESQLKESRLKQTLLKEHVMAVEALKARQEFMETIARQKAAEAKIAAEQKQKHEMNRDFSTGIKEQIYAKEVQKKHAKDHFLAEGQKAAKERQERKDYIDGIVARKLDELRKMGISENHCHEIQRKVKMMEKLKISDQPSLVKKEAVAASKGQE